MNIVHSGKVMTIGEGLIEVRVALGGRLALIPATVEEQRAAAALLYKNVHMHVVIADANEAHAVPEDSARYRAVAQALEEAKDVTALRAEVQGGVLIITSPRGIEHEQEMAERIGAWALKQVHDETVANVSRTAWYLGKLAARLRLDLTSVINAEPGAIEDARTRLDRLARNEEVVRMLDACLALHGVGPEDEPTQKGDE